MANDQPCPIKRAEIIEALRENQPCTANELAGTQYSATYGWFDWGLGKRK